MVSDTAVVAAASGEVDDVGLFEVVDLLVDEDNFRMEPNPNQPAAIKAMLRRQGSKLITLAEDILENGLSHGEFIWVAPSSTTGTGRSFVVCEGNRRVTALKLMHQPALAEGTTWAQKFRELNIRFEANPVLQVRGVLYASVDAARPDVYRRHTNAQDGRGLEDWDPFAQDRANKAEGKRRSLSMVVMELLTSSTIEGLADSLGIRDRTTNADRLLSTFNRNYADRFGIRLKSVVPYVTLGEDQETSEEVLWAILRASDVAVDAIKSEEQRRAVLSGVIADVAPEGVTPPEPRGRDDRAEPRDGGRRQPPGDALPSPPGPRRDPLDRKTLAPTERDALLHVNGVRLTGLYAECRGVDVASRPNAAAMLLRVFLELSCEQYLENGGVRPPGSRENWSDYGITLEVKIRRVLSRIDPTGNDRQFTDAHSGLSDDVGQSHSIRSLHRAMHDRGHVLDARQIKIAWQRWQPLLKAIYPPPS